jgi:hypothetical protein|tara:strand:+ start:795 stop:1091 length:297 start_codon:yes stop_codon:yes gene_type:complete
MDLLTQLAEAKTNLESLLDRFDRYDGNNPNKYESDIKSARSAYDFYVLICKTEKLIPDTYSDLIPYTDKENLDRRLSAASPNAKSKQKVYVCGYWLYR